MQIITNKSKARILEFIKSRISCFQVPELIVFSVGDYWERSEELISKTSSFFQGRTLAVRSSANDEDGQHTAKAGEYESVLSVSADNPEEIRCAIERVILSYSQKSASSSIDEIIVQEMVLNTVMSGVVFTHDLNTGAPYYVINYDDVSGQTHTVTSGDGEYANRTLYIHRDAATELRSERFQRLIRAVQEVETVLDSSFLDIEFALGADLTPYLLQVRSITTQPNWNRAVSKRINAALEGVRDFVCGRFKPLPGIYGNTTVFGQMPDWNPAEMIGRAPRALAFSLYKVLITDNAWRIARERMGYAVPVGYPLMVSLAGQPFIDTRLSFHSFLPTGLSSQVANKLVDAWVARLKTHPELHDKVEFEIAITTYSFDVDSKIATLVGDALNPEETNEFKDALRKQTRQLLAGQGEGCIPFALAQIEGLARKQSKMSQTGAEIVVLFGWLDDCIRLGTIPFSILARHGFIGRTILMSLKTRGILTEEDVHRIQSSVCTVAGELVNDMHLLQQGKLLRSDFMQRYGHLRPGTYDILSKRYDQMPDFGVGHISIAEEHGTDTFELNSTQRKELNRLLEAEGFADIDADRLLDYVRSAIVGREYGKFVFTRSVSNILERIAAFGEKHGLSREELSHIPIHTLLDVATTSKEVGIEERLRAVSETEAEHHALSVAIRLPQVLFDEAGVHVVPFQVSHPNFITNMKITAPCINLDAGSETQLLAGRIVLIENADPGFDWIFSQQIAGLITKYGGANSHMAIRCAEFGIPAAIGCGEQRFELIQNAAQILLDCAAGLINPLH